MATIEYTTPQGRALVARARDLHQWRPRGVPAPIGHRMRRWRLARLRRHTVRCDLDGGLRFLADLADPIQCILCENGEWEGKIWDDVLARVPRDGIAIDVGAHAGYSVLRIAQAVGPNGHVHAFEPVPALRAQTLANIRLNDLDARVTLHPEAVSEREGAATLFFDPLESAGMSSLVRQRYLRRSLEVRTVALDAWLPAHGLDTVAFVKVDVEGAESQVLGGMATTLQQQRVDLLLVEVHLHVLAQRGDEGGKQALTPLREAAYTLRWWTPEERFESTEPDPTAGVGYLLAEKPRRAP